MSRSLETSAIAVVSAALAAAWYLFVGDVDLNLADEGFLWHGVQRTLAGEVPKRDFQAYDPGRYYLCAAWCGVFGDGILSLRAALAAVQAAGVFFGLCALRRVAPLVALIPLGAMLVLWMFPQHKVFEPAFAMLFVWAGTRLIERPSAGRHALAGAIVGLGGCVGLNLALYGSAGLGLLVAYLLWKAPSEAGLRGALRRGGAFALGGLLGYAPMLLAVAFVPGYASSFAEGIRSIFQAGTNVPLPYPWPWRVELGDLEGRARLNRIAVAIAFALPVLALVPGLLVALRARGADVARASLPIAATCVGLFFLHHVSVRSDPPHLAQSFHPILMLVVGLPVVLIGAGRATLRWAATSFVWVALWTVSALAVHDSHPSLVGLHAWRPQVQLRPLEVAGDTLRLPPWTFEIVRRFQAITGTHVPPGEPMLIAPYSPTLYPVSGRASPVYTSYFLWKADAQAEQRMIDDLTQKRVNYAWVTAGGMDGDPERALDRTHPRLWTYLTSEFELIQDQRMVAGSYLLRRRR